MHRKMIKFNMEFLPVTSLLRLFICVQVLAIMTMIYLYLHGLIHYDTPFDRQKPRIGRPRLTWKYQNTRGFTIVPIGLTEYQELSEILGYENNKKLLLDRDFFKCVDEFVNSPCNVYHRQSHFRITNFKGAGTTYRSVRRFHTRIGAFRYIQPGLVSIGGKYIPKGFHIPRQAEEFLLYAYTVNHTTKWLQKSPERRPAFAVQFKEFNELDLTKQSVIQEFIPNPFLIDGRKFSIGVYVAFSSGNPLRTYVLDSQCFLRFCPKQYDPQDLSDPKTYVTDGPEANSRMIREVDSLRNYSMAVQYSSLQSLHTYVDSIGGNWSSVKFQITDAVRDVLSTRKDLIIQQNIQSSNVNTSYFELTRWDFMLDTEFKLHLFEVDPMPATSCITFSNNQLDKHFCINVIYNLFRVMGIANFYDFHKTSIHYVIRDSDVNVENALCYISTCNQCNTQECQLCTKCLSDKQRDILKSVLWEHVRRGETRLVYPFNLNKPSGSSSRQSLNGDTLTTEWLKLKCLRDIQWCDGG